MNKYIPVIGLEIHVALKTKSKMFCGCPADWFGRKPNTVTCPVCLGMPGALPMPNKTAIQWSILIAKALQCTINKQLIFDRKHYFYPDLPKGYQISQYDRPIGSAGNFQFSIFNFQKNTKQEKSIRIRRVHLEEDTGKLIHKDHETLVDFNRSGVPLIEIVTEPDFDNSEDVKRFLEELQTILRYLEVSDCDMEKGSMRLEPNISVKLKAQNLNVKTNETPDYKVEVKNINSFRFVKQAIEYEVKRHIEILEKGETPIQETRGFNEDKQITFSQRIKEEARDYRYFPEPDIPPMRFEEAFIESIRIPELPAQKLARYVAILGIKLQDAFIISRKKEIAEKYETAIKNFTAITRTKKTNQDIANLFINNKINTDLNQEAIDEAIEAILIPKAVDPEVINSIVKKVVNENPSLVAAYREGKKDALIGRIMKEVRGKADFAAILSAITKLEI